MKIDQMQESETIRNGSGGAAKSEPPFRKTVIFSFAFVSLFGLIVFLVGYFHGLMLPIPSESFSMALGFSAALPIFVGFVCYLVVQLFVMIRKGFDFRKLGRNAFCDMTMLLLFVVGTYFHFSLKLWTPFINESLFDLAYYKIDILLEPIIALSTFVSRIIRIILGDEMRWYQTIFHALFFVAFAELSVKRTRSYHQFLLAMILMNGLGALSYLVLPAVGPFFFEIGASPVSDASQVSMLRARYLMHSFGLDWVNAYGGRFLTGGLGAMPSLHVGYAVLLSALMIRSRSYFAGIFVFFTIWIVFDSVGLRWHYVIDLPVGIALAFFVLWLTDRLVPWHSEGLPAKPSSNLETCRNAAFPSHVTAQKSKA